MGWWDRVSWDWVDPVLLTRHTAWAATALPTTYSRRRGTLWIPWSSVLGNSCARVTQTRPWRAPLPHEPPRPLPTQRYCKPQRCLASVPPTLCPQNCGTGSYSPHSLFQQLDHQVTAPSPSQEAPFYHHTAGEEPRLASLYSKLQAIWSTGDMSWKLLCGAVDVGMLTGLTHITSQYKGKRVHVNTVCARLQPLFWFLQNFLLNFWQHSSSFLILDTLPICSLTSLSLEELSVSILQRQMRKAFRSGFPNEEKPVETTALQRPRV